MKLRLHTCFHFIYLRVVWEFTHVNSMKDMIYIFGKCHTDETGGILERNAEQLV